MKIRHRKIILCARAGKSEYARRVAQWTKARSDQKRYIREDPRALISTPGTGNVFVDLGDTIEYAIDKVRRNARRFAILKIRSRNRKRK